MFRKILASVTLALVASVAVVAPASSVIPDPNFPDPEEWEEVGAVVAQLPAPYAIEIAGACAVATIECTDPPLGGGLGYTIENALLRVRLLEGTQLNNALSVEAVIEIRDDSAAFGFLELIPVCVEIVLGEPGDWRVAGDSAVFAWEDMAEGDLISDEYLAMVTTSECDPLMERRDILAIASWASSAVAFQGAEETGWYGADGITGGDAPNQTTVRFEVLSYSWVYGSAGTVTMKATIEGKTGAGYFPNNGDGFRCRAAASPYTLSGCDTSGDPRHWAPASWSSTAVGTSKTFTLTTSSTTGCVGSSSVGDVRWCVPGSPGTSVDSPTTASSLTSYDVFANIIFTGFSEGVYIGAVEGVCEDFEECWSRCDAGMGDIVAMFGWLGCMVTPEIDAGAFWDALRLEVVRSRFTTDVTTMGTYIFSPMRAIGAVGKTCGTLPLIPAGAGPFDAGFGVDTCDWYTDYPTLTQWTWALLVALTWLGAALAIVRIFEGALGLRDPLLGEAHKERA